MVDDVFALVRSHDAAEERIDGALTQINKSLKEFDDVERTRHANMAVSALLKIMRELEEQPEADWEAIEGKKQELQAEVTRLLDVTAKMARSRREWRQMARDRHVEIERLWPKVWRIPPNIEDEQGETWAAYAADLDMQRMEAVAEVERLRSALEPFARWADHYDDIAGNVGADDTPISGSQFYGSTHERFTLTIGECRHARQVFDDALRAESGRDPTWQARQGRAWSSKMH